MAQGRDDEGQMSAGAAGLGIGEKWAGKGRRTVTDGMMGDRAAPWLPAPQTVASPMEEFWGTERGGGVLLSQCVRIVDGGT